MGTVIPHLLFNQFKNNKLIDAINPGTFVWLNDLPTTALKAQAVMHTQNVTSSTVSYTQDQLDNR